MILNVLIFQLLLLFNLKESWREKREEERRKEGAKKKESRGGKGGVGGGRARERGGEEKEKSSRGRLLCEINSNTSFCSQTVSRGVILCLCLQHCNLCSGSFLSISPSLRTHTSVQSS